MKPILQIYMGDFFLPKMCFMLFLCWLYSCLTPHTHIAPLMLLFMNKCVFGLNICIIPSLFNDQLDHKKV